MKDSSLKVCGSGFCVSFASGRFRSTQLCALAGRGFRSTQLCALASRGFRLTQLCALASRRFRSTLTRLAEWCNALGNKKGKRRAATERLLATALSSPPPFCFPSFVRRQAPFRRERSEQAESPTESYEFHVIPFNRTGFSSALKSTMMI